MKENNITVLLRSVCGRIESNFSGVIAEFEDFASPRGPFLKDQYAHMEVFNVPESIKDKLQDFVDAVIVKEFYPSGLSLSMLMWTPEETKQYFLKDVNHIRNFRKIPDEEVIWETNDAENIFEEKDAYTESFGTPILEIPTSNKEKLYNTEKNIDLKFSKIEFYSINPPLINLSYMGIHKEEDSTVIEDIMRAA